MQAPYGWSCLLLFFSFKNTKKAKLFNKFNVSGSTQQCCYTFPKVAVRLASLQRADGLCCGELLHSESVATADLLRRVHATLAVHRPRNLISPGVWEVTPQAPTTCRKTARMRAAAGDSSGPIRVMESDGAQPTGS